MFLEAGNQKSTSPILILFLMMGLSFGTYAAAGDLDPTFGNGGVILSPLTQFSDQITSIQLQPDGKIIVSGYSYDYDVWCPCEFKASGFVARYDSSGILDASFGNNGIVYPVDGVTNSFYSIVGFKIVLQPNGKIVAIGQKMIYTAINQVQIDFAVWRYNSDGTLDTSFGTGGKVSTPVGILHDWARDVVLQPDGKIVVTGLIAENGNGSAYKIGTVRYNSDGSLDANFGAGGKVITAIDGTDQYSEPHSMLLQPDGKIVVAGNREYGPSAFTVLLRYNNDGSLDTSFGTSGVVMYQPVGYNNGPVDSLLQPDGKIVVGRTGGGDSEVVRFNANGSVDSSFNAAASGFSVGNAIALQPDGKIVAFGTGSTPSAARSRSAFPLGSWSKDPRQVFSTPVPQKAERPNRTTSGFAAERLNPNGSLDTSFGINGKLFTPLGTNGPSYGLAVALQPDGKILGAGMSNAGEGVGDAAIVRYVGSSDTPRRAIFDFDGDGRSDLSVFRPSDSVWYLDRSSAGFSATPFGLSTDKITPADYDGDGKTDIGVYRDGTWYWLNSSTASFSAFQFGWAGDIPVAADYTGDGRADLAVYRSGAWWMFDLANNQSSVVNFGLATDKPVAADYDGDGRTDQAVYRNGEWHLNCSSLGYTVVQFGLAADRPVVGDYDGDTRADPAVYRDGDWYVLRSGQGFTAFHFGLATDIPAPADYDGDGTTDAAVYRDGVWYLQQSTGGLAVHQFGLSYDKPVPTAYLP